METVAILLSDHSGLFHLVSFVLQLTGVEASEIVDGVFFLI